MAAKKQLQERIDNLPLLAPVVRKLLALSQESDQYFDQVRALAQEDPTLAMHILKICNSAAHAPTEKITSLKDAIVRVGTKKIAILISLLSVMNVFTPTSNEQKRLWFHSIQVAITARSIACTNANLHIHPEQAYLTGLLHDIGHLFLQYNMPNKSHYEKDAYLQDHQQLLAKEKECFGINHMEVGSLICKRWQLPELVETIVRYHHQAQLPHNIIAHSKQANMFKLIQLADRFSLFLLSCPQVLELSPDALRKEIEIHCELNEQHDPISAEQLQMLCHPILLDSEQVIEELGIEMPDL